MTYATEHLAKALFKARESKGLSQRALSGLVGLPQGHISKIEAGAVDLRVSSLIELARALDLELTLVPRNKVPAVQSVVRLNAPATSDPDIVRKIRSELDRLQKSMANLSHALPDEEWSKLQRNVRELHRLPHDSAPKLQKLRDTLKALTRSITDSEGMRALNDALKSLQLLRNQFAHKGIAEPRSSRPAYTLEEDDHG